MRRILLVAVLFVGLSCAGAYAAKVEAVVAAPFMELHTGPGSGYPVFHVFDRGVNFEIVARRTDWFRVRGPSHKEGWVRLAQMRLATTLEGEPLAIDHPDTEAFLERRWESGVMIGDFGGADAVSVYGSYLLTRNLAVELWGTDVIGRFSDGWMVNASLVHQPFPEWRVSPFVTLGTGVVVIRPRATLADAENRTNQVASVGMGLRMHLTRRFVLRAEYKSHVAFTDRSENEAIDEWKAGFSFFF